MRLVMIAACAMVLPLGSAEAGEERTRLNFTSTTTTMSAGEGVTRINYDGRAVTECRGGDCLSPDGGVMRCVGGMTIVNGVFDDESGACHGVANDGSEWFSTYTGVGDFSTGEVRGTYTYVGGTGRFAGLTGGGECLRTYLGDPSKGLTGSFSDCTGTNDGLTN